MKTWNVPDGASKVYDFVVVGGGSAGAAVAARLAEDEHVSVALVEAGGEADDINAKVPLACGKMQRSEHDWQFYAQADPGVSCLGMVDGRSYWPRGKCLGGSSVLNYMAYVRGDKKDFDSWAGAGAKGWSYDDVLPMFMRAEDLAKPCNPGDAPIEPQVHGIGGPVGVSVHGPTDPIANSFIRGAEQLGFVRGDYNAGHMNGVVSLFQQTIRRGARSDTGTAYLNAPQTKPNLTIVTFGHATRLILQHDQTTGSMRVAGVSVADTRKGVASAGHTFNFWARKEVVVSCGAVGSPQLFLLSGLGPKEELEAVGVPCLRDMPQVGKNLEDHLACLISYKASKADIGAYNNKKAEGMPGGLWQLFNWAVFGSGLLSTSAYNATLFYTSDEARSASPYQGPDCQIGLFCSPGNAVVFENNLQFKPELNYLKGHYEDADEGFMLVPTLLHPHARGSVSLESADPFAHPKLIANYLVDDRDVRAIVKLLRRSLELGETPAMKEVAGEPILPKDLLDQFGGDYKSDGFLEAFARRYASTLYHPTSTMKIGLVVDERLRVPGLPGVRVADASVMPCIVSGNTNAASIMVGEKCADILKADYKLETHHVTSAPAPRPPILAPAVVVAGIAVTCGFFAVRPRL